MTGRDTGQSRQRLPKCRLSRSDDRSQGRRQPARAAREPLTAGRRKGYAILTLVPTQPANRVRFDGGTPPTTSTAIGGRDEQGISVFFKNASEEANGENDERPHER